MKNLKMLPVFVVKKTLILRCVMHFQQVDPWVFFFHERTINTLSCASTMT